MEHDDEYRPNRDADIDERRAEKAVSEGRNVDDAQDYESDSDDEVAEEEEDVEAKTATMGTADDFKRPYLTISGVRQDKRLIPAQTQKSGMVQNPLAEDYPAQERLVKGMWHMSGQISGGKRDECGHLHEGEYELGINMDTCDARLHQAVQILTLQDPYHKPALTVFNDFIKYEHLRIAKAVEIKKDVEKYGGRENVPRDYYGDPITPYFTVIYGAMVTRLNYDEKQNRALYGSLDVFRHSAELMARGEYPIFFPAPIIAKEDEDLKDVKKTKKTSKVKVKTKAKARIVVKRRATKGKIGKLVVAIKVNYEAKAKAEQEGGKEKNDDMQVVGKELFPPYVGRIREMTQPDAELEDLGSERKEDKRGIDDAEWTESEMSDEDEDEEGGSDEDMDNEMYD